VFPPPFYWSFIVASVRESESPPSKLGSDDFPGPGFIRLSRILKSPTRPDGEFDADGQRPCPLDRIWMGKAGGGHQCRSLFLALEFPFSVVRSPFLSPGFARPSLLCLSPTVVIVGRQIKR